MKILILLLFPFFCFAQEYVRTAGTLKELRAITINLPKPVGAKTYGYETLNDGGGAEYYYDAASVAKDDSAFAIKPDNISGAGRWHLYLSDRKVNFKSIGGRPNHQPDEVKDIAFDNYPIYLKAEAYHKANPHKLIEINFPQGPKTNYGILFYHFSKPIEQASYSLKLSGDDNHAETPPSGLCFEGTNAFIGEGHVNWRTGAADYSKASNGIRITNLSFRHKFKERYMADGEIHGIVLKTHYDLDRVTVSWFPGNGIDIYSNAADRPISTNSNSSRSDRVTSIYNAGDGFSERGGDVNVNLHLQPNAYGNKHYGFYGKSFLGTTVINGHFDGNNVYGHPSKPYSLPSSYVWIEEGGVKHYFVAQQDNINQKPIVGKTDNWWTYMGKKDTYGLSTAWRAEKKIRGGGAYATSNINNRSVFLGTYVEDYQIHSSIRGNTTVLGGHQVVPAYGSNGESVYMTGSHQGFNVGNIRLAENGLHFYNGGGLRLNKQYQSLELNAGNYQLNLKNETKKVITIGNTWPANIEVGEDGKLTLKSLEPKAIKK